MDFLWKVKKNYSNRRLVSIILESLSLISINAYQIIAQKPQTYHLSLPKIQCDEKLQWQLFNYIEDSEWSIKKFTSIHKKVSCFNPLFYGIKIGSKKISS